jgi:ABC-2 type transport system ATP-binding protein
LFSLYADLSVEENIRFFSGLYGVPAGVLQTRTQWVLEMAGLADQRQRLTGELALGWKQRLALGCAVIHEPPVLFLDEPTSGVDPISRRSFWDLIYSLAGGGTTVFVSTHYMEEAEYCQRLALMNRGRLVALDTPTRLRASMSEPLLEIRTGSGPAAVEFIRDVPGVIEAGLFGRAVHVMVHDAQAVRPQLEERLRERGVAWDSIDEIIPSLEDVFIARIRSEGGALSG